MFLHNSFQNSSNREQIKFFRLSRLPIFLSGAFFIFWAFFDPVFRDAENYLTGLVCLPLSLGAVSVISALTIRTEWQGASFWFGLAVIGQAAVFQITFAGPALHYQHLKPFGEILAGTSPLIWGYLILQAVLVSSGIFNRRQQIWIWLKTNFRPRRLILIFAAFFICSTTLSENVSFYIYELLLAGALQTINLGNIVLAAWTIPASAAAPLKKLSRRLLGDTVSEKVEPGRLDRFILFAAFFVVVLAAVLNFYSYERHPHIPDEVAYLTQARFFAAGKLTMPAPPVPEAFEVFLLEIKGDRWYATPPPGWPMILAIGVLFGAAWLVNPILAGVNVLLAYILFCALYPKPVARISIILLCLSPWYIFIGMSFMTHMAALTAALLAALGVIRARKKDSAAWAWAGGFALGFISLIRPLEAVAAAGLLGLWAAGFGGRRLKFSAVAGLVLGSMLVGSIGLFYNARLTGDPLKFPIMEYSDRYFGKNSNAYGFGPDRGMNWSLDPNPGHGPFDALVNSNLNISTLNTELFGWSTGSLLLILIFLFSGRPRNSDFLMWAVVAAIYALHFFYYYSGGPDFSARYWFLMVVPLVALSARGIQVLAAHLRDHAQGAEHRLYAAVAALCLMTLLNFIPWRAIDKYHNFRGMRPDIRYLAEEYDFGKSLVMIHPGKDAFPFPDYDSAMIYNRLDLSADAPIYAWNGKLDAEKRKKLLEAFPDRTVWIIKSPSATQRGYKVVAGPLEPEDFLKDSARFLNSE